MKPNTVYLIVAFIIAFGVLLVVPLWQVLGMTGGESHAHAMTDI
jgi:hypothetical protein